jgi:hypothetical protein
VAGRGGHTVAEGPHEPVAQEAGAHCGERVVEHACERGVLPAGGVADDLQIADGRRVEDEGAATPAALERTKVTGESALRRAHVLHQRARGPDQRLTGLELEGPQRPDAQRLPEKPLGPRRLEPARRPHGDHSAIGPPGIPEAGLGALRQQDLRRPQRRQQLAHLLQRRALHAPEVSGRGLEERRRQLRLGPPQGDQPAPLPLAQQLRLRDRPGREHPDHLAAHQAPGLRGVLHLLRDRHLETRIEELADVAGEGVVGDPAHRRADLVVVPAPGEDDAEDRRGLLRILEEQLVEIAEPVEEQRVLHLVLELQVLLQHRRLLHASRIVTWSLTGRAGGARLAR